MREGQDLVTAALLAVPRWCFHLVVFLTATALSAYLALDLFQGLPALDDSVASLYQARILSHGRLLWPIPESLKPFFDLFGVITPIGKPGYWAGMFPPGWPLVLMLGVLVGLPWMVNPVLGGLLVVMTAALAEELYEPAVGRLAGLLLTLSPMAGVINASHLSHTTTALAMISAWWALARLLSTRHVAYGLMAGAAAGLGLLTRPVTALLIGIVLCGFAITRPDDLRAAWRGIAAAIIMGIIAVSLLLAFQFVTTGSATTLGHQIEMQSAAQLGFGRIGTSSRFFTPHDALTHTLARLQQIDDYLLGWPLPAWLLCLAPFFLLRWCRHDVWMLLPLVVLAAFYAFFWYYEEWFPGRYLYASVPLLAILAARGWYCWHEFVARFKPGAVPAVVLTAFCAYALAYAGPHYQELFRKPHGDVEDRLPGVLERYQVSNALVFMASTGRLPNRKRNDYFATGFLRNALDRDGDVVFARDARYLQGLSDEQLIAHYPDRQYYYYQYNQSRHEGRLFRYRVESGRIIGRDPMPGTGED